MTLAATVGCHPFDSAVHRRQLQIRCQEPIELGLDCEQIADLKNDDVNRFKSVLNSNSHWDTIISYEYTTT